MNVNAYIQGGIGNQCFIYAAARSLADQVGADLKVDMTYLTHDLVYNRQFELGSFNVRVNQMVPVVRKFIKRLRKIRYYAMSRTSVNIRNYCCERRPFRFQVLPKNWNDELTLEGYWQSERYFSENAKQIVADLTLKDSNWIEGDPVAQAIRSSQNSTFLHVRSYKEVPGCADGHAALPVEYYLKALKAIENRINGDVKVFVFSDDLDWAREKLLHYIGANAVFVTPIRDDIVNNTHRDFQLMRLCLHGIVANSSFSWWAGWLGEQDWIAKGGNPIRTRIDEPCMNKDYWPQRWIAVEL
jgi:hypothetical protein